MARLWYTDCVVPAPTARAGRPRRRTTDDGSIGMPKWARHIAVAAIYVTTALVLAWMMWQIRDPIAPALAILVGGLVLVVGWLMHDGLIRRSREASMTSELTTLNAAFGEVRGDIARLRADLNDPGPHDPGLPARHARLRRAGFYPEDGDMTGEVRMLQSLVERITGDRHAEQWEATGKRLAARASIDQPPLIPRPRPAVLGGMPDAQMLRILREALRFDRLDLYVQPVLRLPSRRIAFYECFCHIRGPDGAHLPPEQYAPVAEQEGMISSIDNLLLIRTVQLARRALQKNQDYAFFCSLSGFTLTDNAFLEDFMTLMEDNARFASKIIFQFAQNDIDALAPRLRQVTERLARSGYRFAMDRVQFLDIDYEDLGALNFRYVKLPVPLLLLHKLQAPEEEDLRNLRRTVDRFAIDLVAEQLDTEEQVKDLIDYNIDFGQGGLFGLPQLAPGEIPPQLLPRPDGALQLAADAATETDPTATPPRLSAATD